MNTKEKNTDGILDSFSVSKTAQEAKEKVSEKRDDDLEPHWFSEVEDSDSLELVDLVPVPSKNKLQAIGQHFLIEVNQSIRKKMREFDSPIIVSDYGLKNKRTGMWKYICNQNGIYILGDDKDETDGLLVLPESSDPFVINEDFFGSYDENELIESSIKEDFEDFIDENKDEQVPLEEEKKQAIPSEPPERFTERFKLIDIIVTPRGTGLFPFRLKDDGESGIEEQFERIGKKVIDGKENEIVVAVKLQHHSILVDLVEELFSERQERPILGNFPTNIHGNIKREFNITNEAFKYNFQFAGRLKETLDHDDDVWENWNLANTKELTADIISELTVAFADFVAYIKAWFDQADLSDQFISELDTPEFQVSDNQQKGRVLYGYKNLFNSNIKLDEDCRFISPFGLFELALQNAGDNQQDWLKEYGAFNELIESNFRKEVAWPQTVTSGQKGYILPYCGENNDLQGRLLHTEIKRERYQYILEGRCPSCDSDMEYLKVLRKKVTDGTSKRSTVPNLHHMPEGFYECHNCSMHVEVLKNQKTGELEWK